MREKDIKILWGRAASRCSICRHELTSDDGSTGSAYLIGEQAHIIGEKPKAPRGESPLDTDERNSYHNIILLCPNHHKEIDKNPVDWPVEKLHMIKDEHEQFVSENFASSIDPRAQADTLAIATQIDAVDKYCKISAVHYWGSNLISAVPRIERHLYDDFIQMQYASTAAIWPQSLLDSDLKKAFDNVAVKLNEMTHIFALHIKEQDEFLAADMYYKNNYPNPNYQEDAKEYQDWIDSLHNSVLETTKALNLFCDVVRDQINPLFYLNQGRAVLSVTDEGNNSIHLCAPAYTETEARCILGFSAVA